jgi:glutamate transport system substrate-binding protein
MSDGQARRPISRLRGWVTHSRLVILFVTCGLLLIPIGIVALQRNFPPTRRELLEKAGLIGRRELVIGVIDDMPNVSKRDSSGRFEGFDIDIGHMVAGYLGFSAHETKFVAMASENRASMRAYLGKGRWVSVDLVIASYSITEEREERDDVTFSAPYLVTWQSVVTRKGHAPVPELGALKDKDVCTIGTSTSESPAKKSGVRLTTRPKLGACIEGVLDGEYEAATTDATLLGGFVAKHPDRLIHHDIALDTVENWGINTGRNAALHTLVNRALWRSRYDPRNREWENAYDRWLRPILEVNAPQDIAIDRQPDVPEVAVREGSFDVTAAARSTGRRAG